jgi:lysophospholipase L1-like esterase
MWDLVQHDSQGICRDPDRREGSKIMRKFTGRLVALAVAVTALVAGSISAPAAAHESEPLNYVALGDSYTAGIGAGPVAPSELGTECYQALPPGYVDVLNDLPDVELAANAACAGWTAAMVPLQVEVASAAGRLDAETDLVTITAGGNDVGFQGILEACLKPSLLDDCKRAVKAGEATARTAVLTALTNAYAAIRAKAPNATIVALGYPNLFSPEFGDQTYITDEAARVFNKGTDTLNKVIRKAARQVPGTVYVDVTDEFDGHGIGSPDSWILLDGSSASFHPNATGYAEGYAGAVVQEAGIRALQH